MRHAPPHHDPGPRVSTVASRHGSVVPIGLTLVVLGSILLAGNLGWLDPGELLREWWPVALVAIGLWWLVAGAVWAGAALAVVGGLLLANSLGLADVAFGRLIFPSLLILLGGALLNAGSRVRSARGPDGEPLRFAAVRPGGTERGWPTGQPAATAIFGDARLVVSDGGLDLELDRVTVTVLSIFGDVKVDVPAGWRVEDHTNSVFGTVKVPQDQPTYAEAPVVDVHGLALFGDAKVRYLDAPDGGR